MMLSVFSGKCASRLVVVMLACPLLMWSESISAAPSTAPGQGFAQFNPDELLSTGSSPTEPIALFAPEIGLAWRDGVVAPASNAFPNLRSAYMLRGESESRYWSYAVAQFPNDVYTPLNAYAIGSDSEKTHEPLRTSDRVWVIIGIVALLGAAAEYLRSPGYRELWNHMFGPLGEY